MTGKKIYQKVWKLQPKIWSQILWVKMKSYFLWRKTVRYGCPKGISHPLPLLYLHLRPLRPDLKE